MFRKAVIRQSNRFTTQSLSRPISTSSTFRLELCRLRPSTLRALPPTPFRRWQSSETEQKIGEEVADNTGESKASETPATPSAEQKLKEDLEVKNREVIDLKDKYLRSVADFRNLQERTKRDVESARLFAIQRFAADLIESLDNLDRALEAVPAEALLSANEPSTDSSSSSPAETSETSDSSPAHAVEPPNKDLINLHAGLTMTESILMTTLKKHGLERFDPVEQKRKFDPRLDEATFMTKVEGREDGEVFHTQSKGFLLNGRVLRAAKVGVVKNS